MDSSVERVSSESEEQGVSLMSWIAADRPNMVDDAIKFGAILLFYSSVTACFVSTFSEVWQLQLLSIFATFAEVVFGIFKRLYISSRYCTPPGRIFSVIMGHLPFSLVDILTRRILVHELGHWLACVLLTSHVSSIIIFPFRNSGLTNVDITSLNLIGRLLGARWTLIIIVAFGPLASFITALLSLSYSYFLDANSDFMAVMAIIGFRSLFGEISYALLSIRLSKALYLLRESIISQLSQLSQESSWIKSYEVIVMDNVSDFLILEQFGYHPLAFIAAMIIIPICLIVYIQRHRRLYGTTRTD